MKSPKSPPNRARAAARRATPESPGVKANVPTSAQVPASAQVPPSAQVPGPRWRRRAEARPAEILDAALTVFSAHGFAGAKLDEVAEVAGISKGTLYLYFDSKTALFEAMALEIMQGPVLTQLDAIVTAPGGAAEALARLLQFLSRTLEDPRRSALPKLIISESPRFPELARIWLTTVIRPVRQRIIGLLERGIAAGEFRKIDAFETSKLVIAPFLVAALWRQTFDTLDARRSDAALMLRQHSEILLRGLAAASPSNTALAGE